MGFSVAVSFTVFAVGLIACSIVLYGAFNNLYETLQDGLDERYHRELETDSTSMELAYLSYSRADNTLVIHVVNDGETVLDPNHVDIVINGTLVDGSDVELEVEGRDTSVWAPGETLECSIADVDLLSLIHI
mgnify:CR=1 FL=1